MKQNRTGETEPDEQNRKNQKPEKPENMEAAETTHPIHRDRGVKFKSAGVKKLKLVPHPVGGPKT